MNEVFTLKDRHPIDPNVASGVQAASIDRALSKRGLSTFHWANATAKAATTGMLRGDYGFQSDTGVMYRFDGVDWVANPPRYDTGWLPGTITLAAGFSDGTGTNVNQLRVIDGTVFWSVSVSGSIPLGTSYLNVGSVSGFPPPDVYDKTLRSGNGVPVSLRIPTDNRILLGNHNANVTTALGQAVWELSAGW